MTQPTYIVHHEQLERPEQRARWRDIAAAAPVLVLGRAAVSKFLLLEISPLEAWLAHQAAQGGTG